MSERASKQVSERERVVPVTFPLLSAIICLSVILLTSAVRFSDRGQHRFQYISAGMVLGQLGISFRTEV